MATLSPQPGVTGDSRQLAQASESYAITTNALVIAELPDCARAAGDALALAGIRAAGEVRFEEAMERLSQLVAIDLILIETDGAPDALIDAVLTRADAIATASGAAVVAAIGTEQIDLVAAQLLGPHCQLLCTPSMPERVSALTTAKGRVSNRLHQPGRSVETERLQRLNEEVARIADTLTRLTRGEERERGSVRAAGLDYRGPDDGAEDDINAQEIRAVIRSRRLRAQYFTGELFADPAWDMLLDLFAASIERRRVSVSSLCIAAAVPPTTALRWIGTLHEAGLFERHADPSDRRRAYIALSAKALEGMRCYAAAAKRQGLPLV
jgi:hypothetical protein